MARQFSDTLVKGQRYVAVVAMRRPSTRTAFHDWRIAASVVEEYSLSALVQGLIYFFGQAWREGRFHDFLSLQLFHILDDDFGQGYVTMSFGHTDVTILTALVRIIIGLDSRCRRAEQSTCTDKMRQ